MRQKKSYKNIKPGAVVREYRLTIILLWLLHILTIPLAAFFIWRGFSGQTSPINGILTAAAILFANYLIRVLRILKLNQLNSILTADCDPVKYETVFRAIRDDGWKNPNYTLNIARARYYQGDWQGAVAELKKMPMPKEKSILILQYYNLLANCLEMEGDFSRLIEICENEQKIITALKERSNLAVKARQLLTIIDGILTFHRQNVTRAREIYEELFDNASFTLSRLTSLWKLAQLDPLTGAGRSAIDRCEYIIDAGGTTFYVAEAERILGLCRKPSPRLEESPEKEEADGAE